MFSPFVCILDVDKTFADVFDELLKFSKYCRRVKIWSIVLPRDENRTGNCLALVQLFCESYFKPLGMNLSM